MINLVIEAVRWKNQTPFQNSQAGEAFLLKRSPASEFQPANEEVGTERHYDSGKAAGCFVHTAIWSH